jgi:H+/Cl- antiporter ClcA
MDFGSPTYCAVLCCCTAAILSSTLNVPLAAIPISVAIFNNSYILPAVIGSFISFILFRSAVIFEYPDDEPPERRDEIESTLR